MQHYFEKSNDIQQFQGSDKKKSYTVSPQLSKQRKLSENNGVLSEFLLLIDQNDEKQLNELIINEEYKKIQNPLSQGRKYANSVAKRRTPISFKIRGSSVQKMREQSLNYIQDQSQNKHLNIINEGEKSKYQIRNNQDLIGNDNKKQTQNEKKLIILPKCFEDDLIYEINNNKNDNIDQIIDKAYNNSPILQISKDASLPYQNRKNQIFQKAETELFRQRRIKKKINENQSLHGKQDESLNNFIITNTQRLQHTTTPTIDTNENNIINQRFQKHTNPRTLPFLSIDRGANRNNIITFDQPKTCTAANTVDSIHFHLQSINQKKQLIQSQQTQNITGNLSNLNPIVNQNSVGNIQFNKNNIKNNTINLNQTIKTTTRYFSITPSRKMGEIHFKDFDENCTRHNSKIKQRTIQQRRNDYKQNNQLELTSQIPVDNIISISTQKSIPIENSKGQFVNQHSQKPIQLNLIQNNSPTQQYFNKNTLNKIIHNFQTINQDVKQFGKGQINAMQNNIPKHPLFQQISQRHTVKINQIQYDSKEFNSSNSSNKVNQLNNSNQINNQSIECSQNNNPTIDEKKNQIVRNSIDLTQFKHQNGVHLINNIIKNSHDCKDLAYILDTYKQNNKSNIEFIVQKANKISNKLNNLQTSLNDMKSQNQYLLNAIQHNEMIDIQELLSEQQKQQTKEQSINNQNNKQSNNIDINKIIPLIKQCFDQSLDINDPINYKFLMTDKDDQDLDSDQEEQQSK